MDTVQILCTLQNVKSFLGVFPSDLLPIRLRDPVALLSLPIRHRKIFTLAKDSYRTQVLQRLLFRLLRYPQIIPAIQNFLRHNCTVWNQNTVKLLGLTSTVCGQYCYLFTLYMDREYTPKQIIGFSNADIADCQVNKILHLDSDLYAKNCAVVNAATTCIKGTTLLINLYLLLLLSI